MEQKVTNNYISQKTFLKTFSVSKLMEMINDKIKEIVQQGMSLRHWILNQPGLQVYQRQKVKQNLQKFLKNIWESLAIVDVEKIKVDIIEYFPKQRDENGEKSNRIPIAEKSTEQIIKQQGNESYEREQPRWQSFDNLENHNKLRSEQSSQSNRSSFSSGDDKFKKQSKAQLKDVSISLKLQQYDLRGQEQYSFSSESEDEGLCKGRHQTFCTNQSSFDFVEKSFDKTLIQSNQNDFQNQQYQEQLQGKISHQGVKETKKNELNACGQEGENIVKYSNKKETGVNLTTNYQRKVSVERDKSQQTNFQEINQSQEKLQKIYSPQWLYQTVWRNHD